MKKDLKIDVYCSDGSPLGVSCKTLYGDAWQIGVGGAESSLLTLCEIWHKAGYRVRLYNDPRELGASPFEQLPCRQFNPNDNRDVLIIFRSPNPLAIVSKGMKVWFSTDQYTQGRFAEFAPQVDKIVCISDYHADFFAKTYQINNVNVIDLPVRVWDYDGLNIPKVPNRLIFTSVPDRGLAGLVNVWNKIKPIIPDLSLVITSDYRLWGIEHGALNEKFRVQWLLKEDVQFLGAIPRKRLIEEQLKADILAYPCSYPELFCITCAEAQYAGAYPVTSTMGALPTTNMGITVAPDKVEQNFLNHFGDVIVGLLKDRASLEKLQQNAKLHALTRFHPDIIKEKWDKIFEEA